MRIEILNYRDSASLARDLNLLINDGWKLYGNLTTCSDGPSLILSQMIIKDEANNVN